MEDLMTQALHKKQSLNINAAEMAEEDTL